MLTGAAMALAANAAYAEYPEQTITMVVPYAAGGGGDTFTRAIADEAKDILGVNILVENRTGAGATIGVGSVARSKPDGYTLGFVSTSPIVLAPNFAKVPYDPAKDLTYLSQFIVSPHPVMVRADSQWQTFDELLAWAKDNPGRLRWTTAGLRGAPHIATQAAFSKEGVDAVFVPMKGSSEVLAGLLGDTVDVGVISDYAVPMEAGQIRVLAEIGPRPIPGLDIPTYKELGYPMTPTIFFGLAGPAGLPDEVVAKWNDTMAKVVQSDRFKLVAERLGGTISFLPHAEFQAAVEADIASTAQALKDLGMLDKQ
ncbi:MAG: tripartite tricarboxylate transporter substrate binding protein [Sneathiellaceae bacterium]